MATNGNTPKITIQGDVRVKLALWLAANAEKFATLPPDVIAEHFLREKGTAITKYHVENVAEQAGVTIGKRAKRSGNGKQPKTLNNRVRCLATHVKHLYEQLSVAVPESLAALAKGAKLSDEQSKLFIETGPSKVTYKTVACGHTMEGVKFSVTPDLRERRVDEYGTHLVDLIHQGDNVEVKTTFAEKSLTVLQTVYQMSYGAINSTTIGIGRLPGNKATSRSGVLLLHPLDGSSTTDDVTFFNAAVSAAGEVNFGTVTADRVFECTFRMMIDESKSDGQLIGTIGCATA